MNTYRVWMRDGYGSLHNAETEENAKAAAVAETQRSIEGAAMTPTEKRAAITVDRVERLNP